MIEHTFFLPILTAATDEKYFKYVLENQIKLMWLWLFFLTFTQNSQYESSEPSKIIEKFNLWGTTKSSEMVEIPLLTNSVQFFS